MGKKLFLACIAILIGFTCYSQDFIVNNGQGQIPDKYDKFSPGIGLGMDYGGIGFNILVYPHKNIGVFGGLGYPLTGLGVNGGAKFRFVSEPIKSKVSPYGLIMYGYNASIKIRNAPNLNKLFYGFTLGLGLDLKSHPDENSYWSFALLLPLRNSEVSNYMDDLKQNKNIEFENKLMPVGVSVGYRIILN